LAAKAIGVDGGAGERCIDDLWKRRRLLLKRIEEGERAKVQRSRCY
jgi:hypothetical protein